MILRNDFVHRLLIVYCKQESGTCAFHGFLFVSVKWDENL